MKSRITCLMKKYNALYITDYEQYLARYKLIKMSSQRARVVDLYKTLLFLGRDYPQG